MVLMMGEVMRWAETAKAFPGSTFWRILAYNQTHVEWAGMSLHDTIQPGFTFLVGCCAAVFDPEPASERARALETYSSIPCGGACS